MINIKSIFKFWKDRDDKKPIRVSKDPVCGMTSAEGIDFVHEGIKYSFCSDNCKQQFGKNPSAFITK